jgi:hypothetical protein
MCGWSNPARIAASAVNPETSPDRRGSAGSALIALMATGRAS